MGVAPVRFDGQDLVQPGYYGRRDISRLNAGGASGSRVLLIGDSKGGVPHNATADFPNAIDRVNFVSNSTELKSDIRSGNAFDGALFALTPSNEPGINGAPAVGIVRVNKATKSTDVVVDVDADDVLDLSSVGYGLFTQQIQYKIEAGTTEGKKITTKFEGNVFEIDDIDLKLFTLAYSSTGTAVTLTIDPAGNLVTAVTAGPGGEDLSIDLNAFDNISALVSNINAHSSGAYSAVLIGDGSFNSADLDKVIIGDGVDLIAGTYTIRATLKAIEDHFNFSNEFINSALSVAAERRIPVNMVAFSFLTGGTEGPAVIQADWQAALDMAQQIDASFVIVASGDAAVHAALSAHVTFMNSVNGRNERQGMAGSSLTDNKQTKIAASGVLNNSSMGYFGTEVFRFDQNGNSKLYPGFIAGAMVVGMSAGNAITLPPTNKSINVIGVKETLSNTDKNDFIKAGIIIAQPSPLGGIRIVRSVTTFQGSNLIANEWSMIRTILFVTKDHRAFVEALVGKAGDETALESVKNRAVSRLEFFVDEKFFVIDPEKGDAFRNVVFNVVGDRIEISYEATVVSPINFILVSHNFTVIGFKG